MQNSRWHCVTAVFLRVPDSAGLSRPIARTSTAMRCRQFDSSPHLHFTQRQRTTYFVYRLELRLRNPSTFPGHTGQHPLRQTLPVPPLSMPTSPSQITWQSAHAPRLFAPVTLARAVLLFLSVFIFTLGLTGVASTASFSLAIDFTAIAAARVVLCLPK